MKEKTFHVYVDSHDRSLLLQSLVELKNLLIQQGRYTDCVDETAVLLRCITRSFLCCPNTIPFRVLCLVVRMTSQKSFPIRMGNTP